MTPTQEQAIRDRLAKATLGPWTIHRAGSAFAPPLRVSANARIIAYRERFDSQDEANFSLIANAPTDLQMLLDALDEARATLKLVYKGSEDAICAMAKENAELRRQLKEREAV